MKLEPADSRRKYPRIRVSKGIPVAWQTGATREVSGVVSLSLGGLFISTPNPPPVGALVKLLFETSGGDVRAQGLVRRSIPGQEMGIQFSNIGYEDRARLYQLLSRLLADPQEAAPGRKRNLA